MANLPILDAVATCDPIIMAIAPSLSRAFIILSPPPPSKDGGKQLAPLLQLLRQSYLANSGMSQVLLVQ